MVKRCDINFQTCKSHSNMTHIPQLYEIAYVNTNRSAYSINSMASITALVSEGKGKRERAHNSKVEPPFAFWWLPPHSFKALFVCLFVYRKFRRPPNFLLTTSSHDDATMRSPHQGNIFRLRNSEAATTKLISLLGFA